jgi:DNA-binding XRE family transcriptional regulator
VIKLYEYLRKKRREKHVEPEKIAEKLGLKTSNAYYKKERELVPFTLKESKIVADMLKDTIDNIFFNQSQS